MRYKYGLLILSVLLAGLTLWYLSQIVIYVLVAAIIALIAQPINRFYFHNLKFGKFVLSPALSAGLAMSTLFLLFFILAGIFTPLIMEEIKIISSLDKDAVLISLQEPITYIEKILNDLNVPFEKDKLIAYTQEKVVSFFTVTNISLLLNQLVGAMGSFVISFFSISFLTFFFIKDRELIVGYLLSLIPKRYTEQGKNIWTESEEMLKRYFLGVLLEIFLVTMALFIGLWICDIKNALLIAVFAGLMNVIPYVGPFIGCGFALLVGITTNTDLEITATIARVLIVFPIVNLTDAFLLQPYIFSNSIKAHPLEIFIVILAGGTIGGIGGMIFAVPAYTVLRLMVKEVYKHFKQG